MTTVMTPRPAFEYRGLRCIKTKSTKKWITLIDGFERPVIAETPKALRKKIDLILSRKEPKQ